MQGIETLMKQGIFKASSSLNVNLLSCNSGGGVVECYNESQYPNLARMAQQYLGCPATSASAERVFSLAGRLYNGLRQNMTDLSLEEGMWAKVNRSPH